MAEKKSAAKGGESGEGDAAGAAAKKKKLMIIGGAAALVVLLGAAAAFFLLGGKKDEEAEKAKAEAAAAPPPPPIYASLGQTFTITLAAPDRPRYMKVAISAMGHDKAAMDNLEVHAPLVRSRLNSLLGAADFEKLRTAEGKEALRTEVLKAVQEVVEAQAAATPAKEGEHAGPVKTGVEQVYFTEFVLQ
jgi:flagellar FliL protein